MEQFGLLRIEYDSFDVTKFETGISELKDTKYNIHATTADAPGVTHCISAVRYAIEQSTGWILPLYYIGDMCRRILDDKNIYSSIIPIGEGDIGDLIFFHRRSVIHRAYMITHVGILVDPEYFFHSSWSRGGVIDSHKERMKSGNIATCKILTRLTDPRGK